MADQNLPPQGDGTTSHDDQPEQATFRRGRRLAIDVGDARIGVASCDFDGLLATPVETIRRATPEEGRKRIRQLTNEYDPLEVIVGLPLSMNGTEGPAAVKVKKYASRLARRLSPIPVRLVDERLSTVSAHRSLRDAGVSTRNHRPIVDQAAAVTILESALEREKRTGQPPGELVMTTQGPDQENCS